MSAARPADYAREKLPMLRARWDGDVGAAVRRYGPRIFPTMPVTALLGLTASAVGPTEMIGDTNTSGSAVGVFGLEGPRVRALAGSSEVRHLLGREVSPELTRAGYLGDIEGQVVTGLIGYRQHLGAVSDRASGAWGGMDRLGTSSFTLRVAAAAYSAGEGIVSAALERWRAPVAEAPLAGKWPELARRVDATPAGSMVGRYRVDGRYGICHFLMRAEERLESGLALERAVNGGRDAAWFASWVGDARELVDRIVLRGFGSFDTGHDGETTTGGGGLGVVEVFGLLLAAWRWLG